jgi:hypothetical protein
MLRDHADDGAPPNANAAAEFGPLVHRARVFRIEERASRALVAIP